MRVKIIVRRISLSFSLFDISEVKTLAVLSGQNSGSLLVVGLYQSYVAHCALFEVHLTYRTLLELTVVFWS
jgi:hypothetical protein